MSQALLICAACGFSLDAFHVPHDPLESATIGIAMTIPRVLFAGKLSVRPIEYGPADAFAFDDRPGELIALNHHAKNSLAEFVGRTVEILVREVEPPSIWTTEEVWDGKSR